MLRIATGLMPSVIDELSQWGPDANAVAPSLADAQSYCRRLARTHYENFPVASLLLPKALRQHFANVYAYCRWADDLGDETGDADRSLALLDWWREQLLRCYAGEAEHPVYVALRQTIDEFGIPQKPFEDLISAFEQDQHVRRYETFDELHDYCRRSADPVGRIVLHLCRNVSEQTTRWSDSICTGLQLANFWQDVARDFDIGRVYLPREDRQRFGYSDNDLEQRRTTPQFHALMQFQVQRAREFLLAGRPLVATMPGRLQIDIDMFVRGGLQILGEIEAIDCDVWSTRPIVSKWTFASLFARSLGATAVRRVRT
jgi:squalene synthase HpnC